MERLLEPSSFTEKDVEQSIGTRFEEMVARYPRRIAVVDKGRELSYEQLNARANQIARALTGRLTEPTRVAIFMEKGAECLAAILGVLKAGHAYVPIDPAFPADRNLYILENSNVAAVLTNHENAPVLSGSMPNAAVVVELEDVAGPEENLGLNVPPDALAYLIYTSGSTGRPKGVMQNHRNTLHGCMRRTKLQRITPEDRMSLFYSCSVMGSVYCIFGALLNGSTLLPYDLREEGLVDLAHWLVANCVTIYHSVASVFRQFATHFEGALLDSSVRLVIFGGERVLTSDVVAARRIFSPEVDFFTGLGSTETGTIRHFLITAATVLPSRVVPIGYPVEGVDIVLCDPVDGEPVPEGEIGEICVHSPYLALGYWNDEEATNKAFSEVPGRPGVRCYRTGDLGQVQPGGLLEHRGRKDFQVKIRGFRVELGEIESALQSHPLVAEGIVKSHEIGEETQLVGYVQPAGAAGSPPLSVRLLRDFLRARLPAHMVPTIFVQLDAMPRTPNGKLDRKALPPPLPTNQLVDEIGLPPETETEKILVDIFGGLLRRANVGTNHNFFDLGGDSLTATQLVARIRDRLGVKLPMRTVFVAPDLKRLAADIDGASATADAPRAGAALEKAPAGSRVPATPAQRRMWFVDRIYAGNSAYNISNSVYLRGSLDVAAMQAAVRAMVVRHEVLRAIFPSEDGDCWQELLPVESFELGVVDLSALPAEARRAAALERAQAQLRVSHDLAKGPLFRCELIVVGEREHLLSLVFNHIIYDNIWSSRIFFKELGLLYEQFTTAGGREGKPRLPPLEFQFSDYAHWEAARVARDDFGADLEYWRQQLADAPTALDLPSDRPRRRDPTFTGEQIEFTVPAYLRLALAQLNRSESTTVFMSMLAVWQLLLARYSGQHDVLVGTPTGRRYPTQTEGMIGLFINNLVMRAKISPEMTFRELLRQVRQSSIEAFTHDELPFERLVETLHPARESGTPPYFQHFFINRNSVAASSEIPGLELEPLKLHPGGSKFDLTLSVLEVEQRLSATVEYSVDLFDRETVERLAANYLQLLSAAIERPDEPVWNLHLVSQAERTTLTSWNSPATEYPAERCTHHLFEGIAAKNPEATAIVSSAGLLSYGELDRRAGALAARLRRSGVGPDTLVGVCLNRSADLVVALLGVMKAGGAYVPLDPEFPADRLRYMLEDSGAKVLLCEPSLAADFAAAPAEVVLLGDSEGLEPEPHGSAGRPDDVAYVIYTSGSTGKPKGVQITHRALTNFLWSMKDEPGLTAEDVVQSLTTVSFDIAGLELYLPLIVGAKVIVSDRETALSPALLKESLERHGATLLQATPVTWRMLLEGGWKGQPRVKVLCGGEAMGLDLASQLVATGCEVWNMYGPTETTIWSTAGRVTEKQDALVVGKPIANTSLYVTNEALCLQPIGVPGELLIGGDGLARGYLGREQLTAERFLPSPFALGQRLYRTGDLVVRRSSGAIEFLGRIDNQVKVRGFRIELGEIETVLTDQPEVRQAVVVARPGESGEKELVAYVLGASGPVAVDALRAAMAAKLPAYMVPSHIMQLEAFPLTPNGKVDRKALPAPKADVRSSTQAQAYQAPRTPTEEILQTIWARVLRIDPPSIDANFYHLGGHSLQAIRIVDAAGAAGLRISPLEFFKSPTIATLAEAASLRRMDSRSRHTLVTLRERGDQAPLFLLHSTPGDMVGYAELLWALPAGRPVFGFQSLGLEDPSQAHDSIESMAAHYVEELLEAVPNGPYHLGGWCFGGSVALEMARQLRRRGAPVGAVLLMETFPRVRRDGHYWLRNAKLLAGMGVEGGRVLVNRLTDFAGGVRHAQDAEEVHALSLERGPFKHRRAVYERNLHAIRTHWSSYYAGPVTLIKGRYSRAGLRDPDYGWHELVDAVDIFEFDTAHASMMKAPFVNTLADVIARSLSKWDHVARPERTSAPAEPSRVPSPSASPSSSLSPSPSPQGRVVAPSGSNGVRAHD